MAATAAEFEAGLGIIAAQFGHHLREVLVIDIAHPLQPGDFAAGEQIEVVEQPGHAGVIAIGLLRLKAKTLGQAARAHSGGVERLDQCERLFRFGQGHAQFACHIAQRCGQVSCLIQLIDQMTRNEGGPRVVAGRPHLSVEMLGQGLGQRAAIFDIRAAFRAPTAQVTPPVCIKPIAAIPMAVPCIAVGIERGAVNIERTVIGRPALADQLINW